MSLVSNVPVATLQKKASREEIRVAKHGHEGGKKGRIEMIGGILSGLDAN